jgi:hypothetical protein
MVSCATSADCAGSQVCGADHLCSTAAKAGTCSRIVPDAAIEPDDAAVLPGDAGPVDAAGPDAPTVGALELVVMGHGQLVAGPHTCSSDCTYMVPLAPIDVQAIAGEDQAFVGWTVGPCVGSQATSCTVTPPAIVGAKFHKGDH